MNLADTTFLTAEAKKFLDEVASVYDMVLIDAPPINTVTDTSILSTLVYGVILVVETDSTEREAVIAAKQQLEQVKARILGVVVNKVRQKDGGYYYYYYYYGEDNKRVKKRK